MVGLKARDPGHMVRTDEHPSSQRNSGVDAARFLEAQHAGILDLGDEEAHFVHVRRDHQLGNVMLFAFLNTTRLPMVSTCISSA